MHMHADFQTRVLTHFLPSLMFILLRCWRWSETPALSCFCLYVCLCVWAGGEGKVGKVVDIRGWDQESGRSVASVTWSNGTTNVYRMGHKGKVDLKYVSDVQGGFYYKEHLPKLGNIYLVIYLFIYLHKYNEDLN